MSKSEDRNTLSIIMMERQTTGLRLGKCKRFTPGMGSFETMVSFEIDIEREREVLVMDGMQVFIPIFVLCTSIILLFPFFFPLLISLTQQQPSSYLQSAPNVSPGPFVYHPEEADKIVLPSRTTPATFKPRRAHGSMEYDIMKGNT
jgi:hypothetical protein